MDKQEYERRLKVVKSTNPSSIITPFLEGHLVGLASKEVAVDAIFPLETTALSSLVAASHCVGSVYSVCYPDGSILPIPLYSIAEQPSGTGKTRVVTEWYNGYIDKASELNTAIRKDRQKLKRHIAQKEKSQNTAGLDVEMEDLERMLEIPVGVTDATPQALEKVMDRNDGFFMVYGTEQNLTKTLLGGLYSDGNSNDGIINSAFNGEHSGTERQTESRVTFTGRPYGGIFCLSQDGTINTILSQAGGTGLAERFYFLREDDLIGQRDKMPDIDTATINAVIAGKMAPPPEMMNLTKQSIEKKAFAQYRKKMESLAVERKNLKEGAKLEKLKRLKFTPEAWACIEAMKTLFERDIAKQKIRNAYIASLCSKVDILVMKTAATLHVMDTEAYQTTGDISIGTARNAFYVTSSLIDGAVKIAKQNRNFGDEPESDYILEFIDTQKTPVSFDKIYNVISRRKDHPFRNYQRRGEASAKMREALDRLIDQERVFEMSSGKTKKYQARI